MASGMTAAVAAVLAPALLLPQSNAQQRSPSVNDSARRMNYLIDSLRLTGAPREKAVAMAASLWQTTDARTRGRAIPDTSQRQTAAEPLVIVGVSPIPAIVDSSFSIVFSKQIAPQLAILGDTLIRSIRVWIDTTSAEVLGAHDRTLLVRVPASLDTGASYALQVIVAGERAYSFQGFRVAGAARPVRNETAWVWPTALLSAALLGLFLFAARFLRLNARPALDERTVTGEARRILSPENRVGAPVQPRKREVIVPEVPDELVQAIADESAILFAGAGLSAQAGLPVAYDVLSRLLDESEQDRAELSAELEGGRLTELAEVLLRRRGKQAITGSVTRLFAGEANRMTTVHRALSRLPFVGAITSAWDSLVERSFRETRPNLVVLEAGPSDSQGVVPDSRAFVVARPFGSIARPQSFLFTTDEAIQALRRSRVFSRTIAAMLGTRSVFFAGTSLRFIQDYLAGTSLALGDKPHFALVPAAEATPLQQELFMEKYRIRLIPFEPTTGYPEVETFVRALGDRVAKVRRTSSAVALQHAVLTSVKLTNIGAFKTLTVHFNPQWNIILGNNGSGKSTLLRAIALGLCGDDADASRSAKKLLRTGCDEGVIELMVGGTTYTTKLQRDGDRVAVVSQFTALQQGKWVALGFPPLRGASTRDPKGVGPAGRDRPVVDDLHPLIRGTVDERLNDLKQWLVNVDAGMRSTDAADRKVNTRLHDSFWSLMKKLTPGVKIDPGEVRSGTWEVTVNTEDGAVSIDQVSQGMSSIFGWLGTALQRMHEIHRDAEDPEREPALVLVDELDAHLHPEWQQRLVGLVREAFPKLQIIATSHSPLVVAGMKAHEVFVASRDGEDRAVVDIQPVPKDVPFEVLRFDQILTSPLFGLSSTRSEAAKREYARLAAMSAESRTPEEQRRYEDLRAALLDSVQPQSTAHGRQLAATIRDAMSAVLREDADPEELQRQGRLTPEVAAEMRAALKALAPTPGSVRAGAQTTPPANT
jgi:hypothetical protein